VLIRVAAERPDVRGFSSPAAVALARQRMIAAQDRVRASLDTPATSRPFTTLPWVSATLTRGELQRLEGHPDVMRVDADLRARPSLAQSTSLIHAPPLWQYGLTGAGWSIAVVDTGVDSSHPFFEGRVVEHACFSTTDPTDGATSLCPGGAGFSSAPGSGEPCPSTIDGCDHGTHIAGVAAGSSATVSGVARGARIIAIQVYSRFQNCAPDPSPCAQSYVSDQVRALEYVLGRAGAGNANRIAAANLSLALPGVFAGACDSAHGMGLLKEAVDGLRAIGIATVVSAGNDGSTSGLSAPACVSSVISVGSTLDTADVVSAFSNRSTLLSLLAPGSSITSSSPGGRFQSLSGTSMAAAHVSGAWGMLKQLVPSASVSTILNLLRTTGVLVPDSVRTYSRICLDQAALALFGSGSLAPGAPRDPTITVSDNLVTLQWSPPTTGGPVSDYLVLAGTQLGTTDAGAFNVGSAQTISAVAGPGTYWVRVVARNPSGQGPPSPELAFTVHSPTAPGAPTGLTATVSGRAVTLAWQAPAGGSTPRAYVIEGGSAPGLANLAVFDTSTPVTSVLVNGVPPGVYYVRVRARTGSVVGPPSAEVVVMVN
jgi:subtilisin